MIETAHIRPPVVAPAPSPDATPLVSPAGWRQHRLHALDRDWPETNCELDLWIELAASRGFEPEAMLGFAVAQDFIGDQFSLLLPPTEELERFYGANVRPLALYERFEDQFVQQVADGATVLLETDSFYLPDSRGVAYRRRHVKSTIAIAAIDPVRRSLDYFHNLGFWRLDAEDYEMVVHRPVHLQADEIIPPFAQSIRFDFEPLRGDELRAVARERLRWRLSRAPQRDPVAAFGATLDSRAKKLEGAGENAFHDWAFHTLRQLGANYELLADHLVWLDPAVFAGACGECRRISALGKSLQFQLARAVLRGRSPDVSGVIVELSAARTAALGGIAVALQSR
jgi:hypothetical protein